MALLAVTSWTANKVQDWLSGLDDSVHQHIEKFALYNVTGRKLLLLSPHDLRTMIDTIGQQELILDAIQQLANVFYGTDTETIVSLAFELRTQSKSLANQLRAGIAKRIALQNATGGQVGESITIETQIGTQTLLLLQTARTLLDWFGGPLPASYSELESFRQKLLCETVDLSERSYSCLRRCGAPRQLLEAIRDAAMRIESLCDSYVKNCRDPVAITPCLLEILTLKLKPADELGIHLHTSPIGAHVIASIAPGSAAALCGKLCEFDEVIQVNSVTVIGWQHRKVIQLFERESESGKTDMLLMIRRRPFALPEYGRLRHAHAHAHACNANSSAVANSASSNANNTLIRASSRPKAKQSIRKNESAATYLPEPGCAGQPGSCNSVELERSDAARGDEVQTCDLKVNGVPRSCEAVQSELNPDVDSDRELLRQAALHQLGGLTQQDSVRYRDRRNTVSIPRRSTANSMTTSQQTDTKLERDSTLKANPGDKTSEQTSQSAGASTQQLNEPASFPENKTAAQQPPAVAATVADAAQSLNVPSGTVHHHRYHSAEALLGDASTSQNDQSAALAAKELTSSTTASSASLAVGIYGMTAPRAAVKRSNAPAQPTVSHDETPNRAPIAIVPRREQMTTTTTTTVTGQSKGQPMTNNKDTIAVTTVSQNMFSYKPKDSVSGTPTHSQQRPELSTNAAAVTPASEVKTNTASSPSSGAPVLATSRRIDRRVSCKDLGKGDFEGWLWRKRRPGRLPKAGWVKRWCVLKHACLYYYKTHEDQRAEGVLQLHGAMVRPDDCGAEKRTGPARHRFNIQNPQIEFKLAAETDLDRNEWLRRLQLISIGVNPRTVAVSQPSQPSTPQHQPTATARSISQPTGTAPSGSCSSTETTVSALSTPNTNAVTIAAPSLSLEGYYSGSSDDDDDVVLLEQRESFIDNTYHPPDCKQCK